MKRDEAEILQKVVRQGGEGWVFAAITAVPRPPPGVRPWDVRCDPLLTHKVFLRDKGRRWYIFCGDEMVKGEAPMLSYPDGYEGLRRGADRFPMPYEMQWLGKPAGAEGRVIWDNGTVRPSLHRVCVVLSSLRTQGPRGEGGRGDLLSMRLLFGDMLLDELRYKRTR
jgi:hypothetical protein